MTRVKWPALTVLEGLGWTAYGRGEWAGRELEIRGPGRRDSAPHSQESKVNRPTYLAILRIN